MAQAAIGMIETKGLTVLVQATDAALKAADVVYTGWKKVGSGLCSVYFAGEVVSVQVITRPHDDLAHLLAGFGAKKSGASGA